MNAEHTPAPRLEVRGLSHAYALKTVLDAVDLTLEADRVLALHDTGQCYPEQRHRLLKRWGEQRRQRKALAADC